MHRALPALFKCVVLQCVAVCCSVVRLLRCIVHCQHCCSALQCVAVCCRVQDYYVASCTGGAVVVSCCVLQGVAVRRRVLQCVAVCCSVLQCGVLCCSVLQCAAVFQCVAVCYSMLQCVTVCCIVSDYCLASCFVLQRVAVCCNVLPYVVRRMGSLWQKAVMALRVYVSVHPCERTGSPVGLFKILGVFVGVRG